MNNVTAGVVKKQAFQRDWEIGRKAQNIKRRSEIVLRATKTDKYPRDLRGFCSKYYTRTNLANDTCCNFWWSHSSFFLFLIHTELMQAIMRIINYTNFIDLYVLCLVYRSIWFITLINYYIACRHVLFVLFKSQNQRASTKIILISCKNSNEINIWFCFYDSAKNWKNKREIDVQIYVLLFQLNHSLLL